MNTFEPLVSETGLNAKNPVTESSRSHVGASKGAPGKLELVQRFVNTELPDRLDRIGERQTLASWLVKFGLLTPDAEVSDSDVEIAKSLRRLLRKAIAKDLDSDDRDALNELANHLQISVSFDISCLPDLQGNKSRVTGALAQLLAAVASAEVRGEWRRLRMCSNPDCGRTFYDRTKNGSGVWCSMLTCGNKHNARKYRTRKSEE